MSTASLWVVGSISQNFRSSLLQVLHGTFSQVSIVTDKVRGNTVGGINIILVTGVGSDKGSEGHDVLGECTSLIRADDGNGSKRLNGRKCTDDGVLGGHDLDSVGVGKSHDSFKTFRNHSNGTDKGNIDGFKDLAFVGIRVEVGRKEGGETHGADCDEEVLGNLINLLQHISLDSFSLVD